jgi:hypothetical protein
MACGPSPARGVLKGTGTFPESHRIPAYEASRRKMIMFFLDCIKQAILELAKHLIELTG